jgi:hypothetical protein
MKSMHESISKYFVSSFQEAGLPIGGEQYNPFVMLEVHYNNEKKESGNDRLLCKQQFSICH